jgi:hypothetical protein
MEYFAQVTALAALAVVAVQQILKLNVVPVYFANKYPVITNIVLSIIASIVVSYQRIITLVGVGQWIAYVGTVAVLAAVTYNMTIRNSPVVQSVSRKTSKTDVVA